MIFLDLQLALFLLLVLFIGSVGGAIWFARRCPSLRQQLGGDLSSTFETLPFGIVLQQPDGTLAFANESAQRLLGCATAQELSTRLRPLGDKRSAGIARNGLLSQPRPIRWWRCPLTTWGELLVFADAGEQQRFLHQQHAFIGQLAHELRTPLTALVAHTEIVGSPKTDAATRTTSLATIQRETQRMTRLVRDLLELYRLEITDDLPLQPTNLLLVAENAIAQVILRVEERGLNFSFAADARLPFVLAHPDRLAQVFMNLLDNAIKYCRPGDTITVLLEARADGVHCAVQDSGPGIAAADLPRVTERLYRGRADVEGSGLGLAIVAEILRRHQATLALASATEGNVTGTTASWRLMYANATTPEPAL